MPIYEYHCAKCAHDFELFVRGETVIACPACESRTVERLMSRPARLGGGGNGSPDFSKLGPPSGGQSGGCGGGGCGCH
jgi:putative FmdB family regulatory protein